MIVLYGSMEDTVYNYTEKISLVADTVDQSKRDMQWCTDHWIQDTELVDSENTD